jgi:hypothetical protein
MFKVNITIDTAKLKEIEGRFDRLPSRLATTGFNVADMIAKSYRLQFLSQTKIAPRDKMAGNMYARRQYETVTQSESAVFIPEPAHQLDTMSPHFKDVFEDEHITNWVRNYYGQMRKTGLSRVHRDIKTGEVMGGEVYVTPDPFTAKAFNRVQPLIPIMFLRTVRESMSGS